MSLPELVRRSAEAKVAAFCDRRVSSHAREDVRLEYSIRGNSITIVERRPPWRVDFGPEWTSLKIAQLRYDAAAREWTLWWADRNERWNRYRDMDPTPDIDELLREIDEDPTGAFWGVTSRPPEPGTHSYWNYVHLKKHTKTEEDLLARAKRPLGRNGAGRDVEEAPRCTADQAESERRRRRAAQARYLEQLPRHADLDVLASDEMGR